MPGSNLYPITVSLPVLTMTEQGNGNAGASSVPTAMEQLEQVLKDATATNKRNSEALDEHGQRSDALLAPFFFFFGVEESLHVHRCQSCQQPEGQIKQTTGECRIHSTSYDKGSCFAMA